MKYDIYASLLSQGRLCDYLSDTICPKHPHESSALAVPKALELTNTVVVRTLLAIEKDAYGIDTVVKLQILIALARCPICKSRFRILPADILPYKHYSLVALEHGIRLYNQGFFSLRRVAWDGFYGDRTPSHTTIHAWTEGLGAYWSGRSFGEVAYALPATRVIAELELRFPQTAPLHSIPVQVNPKRYRSPERRERLESCLRFDNICTLILACCFCELNRLIVSFGNSYGFGFRTGISRMPSEHINFSDMLPCDELSNREAKTCPIRGRSPPFDSK